MNVSLICTFDSGKVVTIVIQLLCYLIGIRVAKNPVALLWH